jgi:hypothetical protein
LRGVLFLDIAGCGVDVSFSRVAGLAELRKRHLAARTLPERIPHVWRAPDRLVTPAWREDSEPRQEVVTIRVIERGLQAMAAAAHAGAESPVTRASCSSSSAATA